MTTRIHTKAPLVGPDDGFWSEAANSGAASSKAAPQAEQNRLPAGLAAAQFRQILPVSAEAGGALVACVFESPIGLIASHIPLTKASIRVLCFLRRKNPAPFPDRAESKGPKSGLIGTARRTPPSAAVDEIRTSFVVYCRGAEDKAVIFGQKPLPTHRLNERFRTVISITGRRTVSGLK